ncbi:MAG: hypothetical protein VXW75_05135 [Pseudomonadota bacterium]|nr:hypothetical protein [Pseudomonadota bacterium]
MIEKRLDARRLNVITIGVGFSEIIGTLRRRADIITVTLAINAVLNVVKGSIKTLR